MTKLINKYDLDDLKGIFKKPEMLTFAGFIVLSIILSLFTDRFLTTTNLLNVARQISINAVIAVGMTFVILTSGIDLSVGSVMAFSGTMMAAGLADWGLHPLVAVVVALLVGGIFGLLNGSLVAFAKMPPIIVTLAMMQVPRGLGLLYTGGYPLSGLPQSISFIGRGYVFGIIPIPVVIMAFVYLVAYILLNHFPLGRYIYAIGGNEEAVRLSGIKVRKYKIIAYVVSGLTAATSGIILSSRLMSGQPMAGIGFELDAIAAVVLGGTDISGGRGSIIGTIIGALILGVLNNGLNLIGVSPYIQRVLKGVIIIAAVYFSSKKEK
jgi:ribose transport system permease protein